MRRSYGPYQGHGLEGPDWVTGTGHVITEDELDQLVTEAECGYEPSRMTAHRVPLGVMREDTVESESTPGTYYHLKLRGDGTWGCDCPGYTYRQECKHVQRKMEERLW